MTRTLLFSVSANDCEMQTFRSGGKGGQHQNKVSSGVRFIHVPSGARGEARDARTTVKRPLRCKGRRSTSTHMGRTFVHQARGCGSLHLAVMQRLCNHSAFNGYRWTPSKYSEVHCLDCGRMWRTKADVCYLPDSATTDL